MQLSKALHSITQTKTGQSLGALGVVLLVLVVYWVSKGKKTKKVVEGVEDALGKLDKSQQQGVAEIVKAFYQYGDKDPHKLAYILATARHESNFRPIKERRAKPSQFNVHTLQNRYWHTGYFGRGYVQLTWKKNYKKMSNFLKVDLVSHPDKALVPRWAAQILVYGMMNGSFTRRPLSEFINADIVNYYQARKTVNGTDRATKIAQYAKAIHQNIT